MNFAKSLLPESCNVKLEPLTRLCLLQLGFSKLSRVSHDNMHWITII